MAERFRHITYGEQMDAWSREIERLTDIVKRVPQRAHELEQGKALLSRIRLQMKAHGKRRSSCFYGFVEDCAA